MQEGASHPNEQATAPLKIRHSRASVNVSDVMKFPLMTDIVTNEIITYPAATSLQTMHHDRMLEQDNTQDALILMLVGLFGSGLAYGNVIAVGGYYRAVLVLAGVVIGAMEVVRLNRSKTA